jgi:hypothetical protein
MIKASGVKDKIMEWLVVVQFEPCACRKTFTAADVEDAKQTIS